MCMYNVKNPKICKRKQTHTRASVESVLFASPIFICTPMGRTHIRRRSEAYETHRKISKIEPSWAFIWYLYRTITDTSEWTPQVLYWFLYITQTHLRFIPFFLHESMEGTEYNGSVSDDVDVAWAPSDDYETLRNPEIGELRPHTCYIEMRHTCYVSMLLGIWYFNVKDRYTALRWFFSGTAVFLFPAHA